MAGVEAPLPGTGLDEESVPTVPGAHLPRPPATGPYAGASPSTGASFLRVDEPRDFLHNEEFSLLWMMGLSNERTLGRPGTLKGDAAGWHQFSEMFMNWICGLPGDTEVLLEGAAKETSTVTVAKLNERR